MSVGVGVYAGNRNTVKPVRVLLTDLELAKKIEWNRRRKLRLQQVRQQAKDLAYSLRNQVKSERELTSKQHEKKCNDELNKWKNCQLNRLHQEYEGCLSEVGAAHLNAQKKPDEDPVFQEQQELMAALSRARGAVALKKAREEKIADKDKKEAAVKCKELARNLENVRAQLISSLPKPPIVQQLPKQPVILKVNSPSKKRKKCVVSRVPSERPVNISLQKNFVEATTETRSLLEDSPAKDKQATKQKELAPAQKSPVKKLCFAPTADVHSFSGQGFNVIEDTQNDETLEDKICSPPRHRRYNLSECEYMSDDSADSDVTWPPRSSGMTKHLCRQKLVKLYDHDKRSYSEYPRPATSVPTMEPTVHQQILSPETMKEECGRVYKTDLEESALRAHWRKKQGLRSKDNLRKEFHEMLVELSNMNREERMKKVGRRNCSGNSSSEIGDGSRERSTSAERLRGNQDCRISGSPHLTNGRIETAESQHVPSGIRHKIQLNGLKSSDGKKESNNSIQQLIEKIQKKREELLNDQMDYIGCNKKKQTDLNINGSDEDEIPTWITDPTGDLYENNDISKVPQGLENMVHQSFSVKERECDKRQVSPQVIPIEKPLEQAFARKQSPTKEDHSCKNNENRENHLSKNIETREDHTCESNGVPESFSEVLPQSTVMQNDSEQSPGQSSHSSTISFQGIKLVIEVSEKKKSSKDRKKKTTPSLEDTETGQNRTVLPLWRGKTNGGEDSGTTSTTYLSPPEHLSPVQQELLTTILNRIEAKNNNPALKQYILRLLSMSRESIENLSETVSDVSLSSDVIRTMNAAQNGTKVCPEPYSIRPAPCKELNGNQYFHRLHNQGSYGSRHTTDSKRVGTDSGPPWQEDNGIETCEVKSFSDLADRYSQRISALAQMIDNLNLMPRHSNTLDTNNTSYLSIPPVLNESIKISDSIDYVARSGLYPRPELSFDNWENNRWQPFLSDSVKDKQSNLDWILDRPMLREEDIAALGLTTELLPKPNIEEKNLQSEHVRSKPPISLQKHRACLSSAVPHELSVIPEAETPSTSHYHYSSDKYENNLSRETTPKLDPDMSFSCLDSEDLDLSSIASGSPKKSSQRASNICSKDAADLCHNVTSLREGQGTGNCDSSLSIISNMSNCSLIDGKGLFSESSSENMEEVFKSLGIGWAWTTWRKIKETKQLSSSSGSPEINGARDKVSRSANRSTSKSKNSFAKYKHSTPVKRQEKVFPCADVPKSSNNGTSFGSSELSSVTGGSNRTDSLTPPNLSLQTPSLMGYQQNKNC